MTNKTELTHHDVKNAVREGKSIRKASKLLGKSYTAVQWWMARNGYRIELSARLVKISRSKEN